MLTLSIDTDSFEELKSGRKKEEYREIKPYYRTRLEKEFPFTMGLQLPKSDVVKQVLFKVGVSPKAPKFMAECTLTINGCPEELGGKPEDWYYVLRVLRILDEAEEKQGV